MRPEPGTTKRDGEQESGVSYCHETGTTSQTVRQPPEDQLEEWNEGAKAHVRTKVEHGFRIMKQQFSFEKSRVRGIDKNHSKVLILAALTNLFMVRNQIESMKMAQDQDVQILKPSHQ